jgi:hypothetical protein
MWCSTSRFVLRSIVLHVLRTYCSSIPAKKGSPVKYGLRHFFGRPRSTWYYVVIVRSDYQTCFNFRNYTSHHSNLSDHGVCYTAVHWHIEYLHTPCCVWAFPEPEVHEGLEIAISSYIVELQRENKCESVIYELLAEMNPDLSDSFVCATQNEMTQHVVKWHNMEWNDTKWK